MTAADAFMEDINVHSKNSGARGFFYRIYDSATDFHTHKWMYDADSLIFRMQEAGFLNVEKKDLFDSKIEDIQKIELNKGLCVEGAK